LSGREDSNVSEEARVRGETGRQRSRVYVFEDLRAKFKEARVMGGTGRQRSRVYVFQDVGVKVREARLRGWTD